MATQFASFADLLSTHLFVIKDLGLKLALSPKKAPFTQPESLRLVGTCGDGVNVIQNTTALDMFIGKGGGFVVGTTEINQGLTFFGEVGTDQLGQFEHFYRNGAWSTFMPPTLDTFVTFTQSFKTTQLWWFAPVAHTSLSAKLHLNPHFPAEELEFIPKLVLSEMSGIAHWHYASSCTMEQIAVPWGNTGQLHNYAVAVPPSLRSLQRVRIIADDSSPLTSLPDTNDVIQNLRHIFAANGHVTAHTLILEGVTTDIVMNVVIAKFENLFRLVLENCPNVDFNRVLPYLVGNQYLKELRFDKRSSGSVDGQSFHLAQQCRQVTFMVECGVSVPPAQWTGYLPQVALHQPMKLAEFNEQNLHQVVEEAPVGLLTAYGQVVPLAKNLVPRFHLLKDMLEKDEGHENLVPMELEPPVGKESIALAVHFVSHYLPEAVNTECEKAEAQRGSYSTSANPSFSWCPAFAQFRKLHIQEQYPSSKRRVQVMCELMALAAYLNCPSLKRFLRAALIMEEQEEGESESTSSPMGRGKRDRE